MVVRGTFILPKEASDGGGPMALLMSEIIQKKNAFKNLDLAYITLYNPRGIILR